MAFDVDTVVDWELGTRKLEQEFDDFENAIKEQGGYDCEE